MQFTPSQPDGTHLCPHCGARYRVASWGETPARDADKEACHCCQRTMAEWNATSYPVLELVGGCPGDDGVGFLASGDA